MRRERDVRRALTWTRRPSRARASTRPRTRANPPAYELRYDTRPPDLAVRAEITARGSCSDGRPRRTRCPSASSAVLGSRGRGRPRCTPEGARVHRSVVFRRGSSTATRSAAYDEADNAAVRGLAVKPDDDEGAQPATAARPAARPALRARPRTHASPHRRSSRGARCRRRRITTSSSTATGRRSSPPGPPRRRSGSSVVAVRRTDPTPDPGRYRWYVWPGLGTLGQRVRQAGREAQLRRRPPAADQAQREGAPRASPLVVLVAQTASWTVREGGNAALPTAIRPGSLGRRRPAEDVRVPERRGQAAWGAGLGTSSAVVAARTQRRQASIGQGNRTRCARHARRRRRTSSPRPRM